MLNIPDENQSAKKQRIKRVAISARARFEVLKRDKFTCQYCGAKSPDVVLHVDHIKPVAEGGSNDLLNLVTSCALCNGGKSDKRLSDDTAVSKSRAQAEEMQDRAQQVEMMGRWQSELASMRLEIDAINNILSIHGRSLSESGVREARTMIRKYGLSEVLTSVSLSFDRYGSDDGWSKVGAILRSRKMDREQPELSALIRQYNATVRRMSKSCYYFTCKTLVLNWHRDGFDAELLLCQAEPDAVWWNRFHTALQEIDDAVRRAP